MAVVWHSRIVPVDHLLACRRAVAASRACASTPGGGLWGRDGDPIPREQGALARESLASPHRSTSRGALSKPATQRSAPRRPRIAARSPCRSSGKVSGSLHGTDFAVGQHPSSESQTGAHTACSHQSRRPSVLRWNPSPAGPIHRPPSDTRPADPAPTRPCHRPGLGRVKSHPSLSVLSNQNTNRALPPPTRLDSPIRGSLLNRSGDGVHLTQTADQRIHVN